MRAKQDSVIKARETQLATDERASHLDSDGNDKKRRKKKKKKAVMFIFTLFHDTVEINYSSLYPLYTLTEAQQNSVLY